MGRHIVGTDGFVYKFAIGRRAIDLEHLTKASGGVGELYFVTEYLVTLQDGSTETLALDELFEELDEEEPDEEAGFHEAPDDADPEAFFRSLCESEQERVEDIKDYFEDRDASRVTRVELVANVQYRLYDWEWDEMLTWLNTHLPEELKLTMDALGDFDLDALAKFNPERDRPSRKTGTAHYAHLFKSGAASSLPYLALRVLAHAVQNELPRMDLDDEQRFKGTVWEAEAAA